MSVDRTLTGAAPASPRRARASTPRFDSRAALPGLDSRATRGATPAARPVERDAVDPAATVELSPETVAALVAESTGSAAGEPTAAAAEPWTLIARTHGIAAAAGPGPLPTAGGPASSQRRSAAECAPARCHHRSLLAVALLWGVLATGLLIVACYTLSVVARTGAHAP